MADIGEHALAINVKLTDVLIKQLEFDHELLREKDKQIERLQDLIRREIK